jgi:hypothetical protein
MDAVILLRPSARLFSRLVGMRTTRNACTASKRADEREAEFAEVSNALDDLCHSSGVVAAWRCFVIHAGRIHSHPSRGRSCSAGHPTNHGKKGGLAITAQGSEAAYRRPKKTQAAQPNTQANT